MPNRRTPLRPLSRVLTLLAALTLSPAVLANEVGIGPGPAPAPAVQAASVPAATLQPLRDRMRLIRESGDPDVRMQLMEEQMAAMEALLQTAGSSSPGRDGHRGADRDGTERSRKSKADSAREHSGQARHNHSRPQDGNPAITDEHRAMETRVTLLEQRIDLLQTLLQLQMSTDTTHPAGCKAH